MKSGLKLKVILGVLFVFFLGRGRIALAAPPTNACSLLTTAQVSAVLGVPVEAGKPLAPTITKVCHWGAINAAREGMTSKGAMLTLQDAGAFAYAKMPVGHGIIKVPVSGIGDDAVYGTTPGYPTVLTVKKGDVVFVVHVNGFSDEQIKAKEKTLALDVLAKL
jgi:hypothetical protein